MINAGFETGDFTGWDVIEEADSAAVSSSDDYAHPRWGNYMAVLGTPGAANQPVGPNTISQSFTVASDYVYFAYRVCTNEIDDGFDYFSYEVEVVSDSTTIASYIVDAVNTAPGWQYILIDLSDYIGTDVTLNVSAGGTFDTSFTTWAYFDAYESAF